MIQPITRITLRAALLAALLAGLGTTPALAESRLVNFEQCVESSTELAPLPSSASGLLAASECKTCLSKRLRFDASTRYFIDEQAVTYAQLRTAAGKRPALLYVFYQTGSNTLTRLRLDTVAGVAAQ